MAFLEFPKDFKWGTATAAYQIEGAHNADGKGVSIWDTFSHKPGKIKTGENGDLTCDHFNRYKEDIALMAKLGYRNYRFSIAWTRILPDGKGTINLHGLDFYNRLIDEMKQHGIEPFATLYHWDLPQVLQDRGGWLNRDTAQFFADYTEKVVSAFGDRVKYWITLNEPWVHLTFGHLLGWHAPGVHKIFSGYKINHNLLLAHGYAMQRIKGFNKKLQAGITQALNPVHSYRLDKDNRGRRIANAFINSAFMDPIFKKKYPEEISGWVEFQNGKNLKPDDFAIISEPMDFLGLNNYTRVIVKNALRPIYPFAPVTADYPGVKFTDMDWEEYPKGFYELLNLIRTEYGNIPVYITENGVAYKESLKNGKLEDKNRIEFLKSYLFEIHKAMQEGSDVKGYFVWSFMDNFEWAEGTHKTFGLVHVNFENGSLKRTVKESGNWYSRVIRENGFEY